MTAERIESDSNIKYEVPVIPQGYIGQVKEKWAHGGCQIPVDLSPDQFDKSDVEQMIKLISKKEGSVEAAKEYVRRKIETWLAHEEILQTTAEKIVACVKEI